MDVLVNLSLKAPERNPSLKLTGAFKATADPVGFHTASSWQSLSVFILAVKAAQGNSFHFT